MKTEKKIIHCCRLDNLKHLQSENTADEHFWCFKLYFAENIYFYLNKVLSVMEYFEEKRGNVKKRVLMSNVTSDRMLIC